MDVFISYKHRMRPSVDLIARQLESLALTVWYDEGLASGSDYAADISRNLRAAKSVLVCWTNDAFPHSGDSHGWVRGEAEMGRKRGVLVCASLEPAVDLDPPWNTVQFSDLSSWLSDGKDRAGWRSMLRRIGELTQRPGLAGFDEAWAAGDPGALRAWALQYPADPLTPAVWGRVRELTTAQEALPTRTSAPHNTQRNTWVANSATTPPPSVPVQQDRYSRPASIPPRSAQRAASGSRSPWGVLIAPVASLIRAGALQLVNGSLPTQARVALAMVGLAASSAAYAWACSWSGSLSRRQSLAFLGWLLAGAAVASAMTAIPNSSRSALTGVIGAIGALVPLTGLWLTTGRQRVGPSGVAIITGAVASGLAFGVVGYATLVRTGGFFLAAMAWQAMFATGVIWLLSVVRADHAGRAGGAGSTPAPD